MRSVSFGSLLAALVVAGGGCGESTRRGEEGEAARAGAAGASAGAGVAGVGDAGSTSVAGADTAGSSGATSAGGSAGTQGTGAGTGGHAGAAAGASGGPPAAGESGGGSDAGEGAGPAGAGGGAGEAGDTLEPVRIIRGAPDEEFWDLTIVGESLDAFEGKRVIVRLGYPDRPPERLGSGEARIENGGFELVFPQVWENSLYKVKLVLIDIDDDRACDLAQDRLYGDSRATQADTLRVTTERTPDGLQFAENDMDFYCQWFNTEWPRE